MLYSAKLKQCFVYAAGARLQVGAGIASSHSPVTTSFRLRQTSERHPPPLDTTPVASLFSDSHAK